MQFISLACRKKHNKNHSQLIYTKGHHRPVHPVPGHNAFIVLSVWPVTFTIDISRSMDNPLIRLFVPAFVRTPKQFSQYFYYYYYCMYRKKKKLLIIIMDMFNYWLWQVAFAGKMLSYMYFARLCCVCTKWHMPICRVLHRGCVNPERASAMMQWAELWASGREKCIVLGAQSWRTCI